eukprot:COSAG01_NODE_431_length_17124_cov_26.577386_6_plen_345_part_00
MTARPSRLKREFLEQQERVRREAHERHPPPKRPALLGPPPGVRVVAPPPGVLVQQPPPPAPPPGVAVQPPGVHPPHAAACANPLPALLDQPIEAFLQQVRVGAGGLADHTAIAETLRGQEFTCARELIELEVTARQDATQPPPPHPPPWLFLPMARQLPRSTERASPESSGPRSVQVTDEDLLQLVDGRAALVRAIRAALLAAAADGGGGGDDHAPAQPPPPLQPPLGATAPPSGVVAGATMAAAAAAAATPGLGGATLLPPPAPAGVQAFWGALRRALVPRASGAARTATQSLAAQAHSELAWASAAAGRRRRGRRRGRRRRRRPRALVTPTRCSRTTAATPC